jgi:adenylosuccinate synthase
MKCIQVLIGYHLKDGSVKVQLASGDKPQDLCSAQPIYEKVPGWKKDVSSVRCWDELPENFRNFIKM